MAGRLNLFQAMMLRWRGLHPYTGVHVVRVPMRLERDRLETGIRGVLERRGLTGFELSPARRTYRYGGGASATEVATLPGGSDPSDVLARAIESALNTAFPAAGRIDPFRFFAVDAGDAFHLGLAYDHFIAAADSIVALLAEIVEGYAGAPAAAPGPGGALDRYPPTYWRLFLRHPVKLARGLAHLPAMAASCRRSFRPPTAGGGGRHNGFAAFRVDPPGFRAMRRAAAAWGVTLNDLFMALLLASLAPLAEARERAPRRRELGIASIMNIRGDYQPDAQRTFGQFLGAMRVSHPVPPGATLEAIARDVHAETERVKRGKLYLPGLLALGATGLVWPLLSDDRRDRFLPKNYPVWAGLTTLNVNLLWTRAAERFPGIEYLRAGSTGPLAPFVFAITTVGEVLHVGISYRSAAVPREAVDGVAAEFVRKISALSTCAPGQGS